MADNASSKRSNLSPKWQENMKKSGNGERNRTKKFNSVISSLFVISEPLFIVYVFIFVHFNWSVNPVHNEPFLAKRGGGGGTFDHGSCSKLATLQFQLGSLHLLDLLASCVNQAGIGLCILFIVTMLICNKLIICNLFIFVL